MAHEFNYKTIVMSDSEYDALIDNQLSHKLEDIRELLEDIYSKQLADDVIKCIINNML